jgi:RsiW-degrading membrane proteinase PrsW (M82 family)
MEKIIFISCYVIFVVLPIIFWLGIFLFWDRKEPEPKKIISKLFLLSVVAIILAVGLEETLDRVLFSGEELKALAGMEVIGTKTFILLLLSYFLAGPIEELVKYLILRRITYKNKSFNQIADGVIYGVTLALGFALVENTGYFFQAFSTGSLLSATFFSIVIFRGIATTLLHVTTTGIMGLFMGRARFNGEHHKPTIIKGIIIASLLHGVFNMLIFFPLGMVINIFLVVLVMIYLVYQLKTKEAQEVR